MSLCDAPFATIVALKDLNSLSSNEVSSSSDQCALQIEWGSELHIVLPLNAADFSCRTWYMLSEQWAAELYHADDLINHARHIITLTSSSILFLSPRTAQLCCWLSSSHLYASAQPPSPQRGTSPAWNAHAKV
ncbi:hypothetical protein AC578_8039 [Pseudocercospora eumusae]|uniref:Uncharacterized protein n=1 Tax=Pseudocercospora eumusae TaxID=321146 RepID=A0A139HGR0_9PEZI|nr:hypothetical protein AC578_8039 [Pseudocercospora eumusae]